VIAFFALRPAAPKAAPAASADAVSKPAEAAVAAAASAPVAVQAAAQEAPAAAPVGALSPVAPSRPSAPRSGRSDSKHAGAQHGEARKPPAASEGAAHDAPLTPAADDSQRTAPEASAAKATATEPASASGYLSLDSAPWSNVLLAGKLLGTTPLVRLPLPPGKYVLTLQNPELGKSTTYVVEIKSGATVKRMVGWE
jgi:hypothetical protein